MKSYLGVITYKKASYCAKAIANIYRIKRNKLIYLGQVSYNTGAMKGHESEVYQYLVYSEKELSEKQYKETDGYYRWSIAHEKGFRIDIIEP